MHYFEFFAPLVVNALALAAITWFVIGLLVNIDKWVKAKTRLTEALTMATRVDCGVVRLVAPPTKPSLVIPLTRYEVESGLDRLKLAAALIEQLPETHAGAKDWLGNYRASNDEATDVWRINAGLGPYGRHLDAS